MQNQVMKNINAYIRQQWVLYFLAVIALFASLEIAMRTHEAAVASLQDGVLLKMQMFLTRDKTDMLFLGTSRTQDSINPTLIVEEMGKMDARWKNARAFNGAAAGGSLNRLEYCVDKAIVKPGLKYIGIEVSGAQLSDHFWDSSPIADKEPANFEEVLQKKLSDHAYIIRYRQTFRLENAMKYPFLMFPNIDDGTKWFGQVGGFARNSPDAGEASQRKLEFGKAVALTSAESSDATPLQDLEVFMSGYREMAEKARGRGIQVFLFVPPVRGDASRIECDGKHLQAFQRIANAAQVPLLRYSCKDYPARYFSDDSHMRPEGRTVWSNQLARDLADAFGTQAREKTL